MLHVKGHSAYFYIFSPEGRNANPVCLLLRLGFASTMLLSTSADTQRWRVGRRGGGELLENVFSSLLFTVSRLVGV